MQSIEGLVLVLVMLVNLYLVSTSRLKSAIQAVATQGALLGIMPIVLAGEFATEAVALAVLSILVKAIAIPGLLSRALREVVVSRDIEPIVSFTTTMVILAVGTGASLMLSSSLPLIPEHQNLLIVPAAVSTMLTGAPLLTTRKKAITQVVGFISFENGVFTFGLLLLEAVPLLVEFGVLLDLFAGIFVMAIIINHVRRTFSSLDTYHLSTLKE